MPDRIYTYVDGESHFIRLEKAWRRLHGERAGLGQLRYKDTLEDQLILHLPRAKVFWTRRWSPGQKTFYFTAAPGDDKAIHEIKIALRGFGLEPCVLLEKKELADQRKVRLENDGVIEKPKTIDAAIIVQMLEDAYNNRYDLCNLYTSDVDYLPVIKAVRHRGKGVFVHGFPSGLADCSPLEHTPDKFFNLLDVLNDECQLLCEPQFKE